MCHSPPQVLKKHGNDRARRDESNHILFEKKDQKLASRRPERPSPEAKNRCIWRHQIGPFCDHIVSELGQILKLYLGVSEVVSMINKGSVTRVSKSFVQFWFIQQRKSRKRGPKKRVLAKFPSRKKNIKIGKERKIYEGGFGMWASFSLCGHVSWANVCG